MQTTVLDPSLTQALAAAREPGLTLIIGNKNYSSWSMRPWVALTAFGLPFQDVRVLLAGEITIWDSLAICEYLAEQFPDKHLWPQDVAARAMARCICAEMHSGFTDLRNDMSMHIKAHLPGRGRTPGAQADIGRISEIWEECLSRFGHHQFLFGEFSIADAYFAPVVMRFRTYGVSLAPALNAYCERVQAHPAVARWVTEALAETEVAAKHDADLPD